MLSWVQWNINHSFIIIMILLQMVNYISVYYKLYWLGLGLECVMCIRVEFLRLG